MKHFKKFIALFLAMIMATSFATTAMAAEPEDSGIPENATAHTIELTVNPDGTVEGTSIPWANPTILPRFARQFSNRFCAKNMTV